MNAATHRLVVVQGEGFKYTNPGGLLRRGGRDYVIARRNVTSDNMATDAAKRSSIVLLHRTGRRQLVDEGDVLYAADTNNGISYEDPRILPDKSGFTYTCVKGDIYCTHLAGLRDGRLDGYDKMMGPQLLANRKNGYLFRAVDGSGIFVIRPDSAKTIYFYRLRSTKEATTAFAIGSTVEWWSSRLAGRITVPNWLRGKRGSFGHVGFGTIVHPRVAIIHFGNSTPGGKYYVTALQHLGDDGLPDGPPEIVAEPDESIPPGDVPGVLYTTMAWLSGRQIMMWSGRDDSMIVETRVQAPDWAWKAISESR